MYAAVENASAPSSTLSFCKLWAIWGPSCRDVEASPFFVLIQAACQAAKGARLGETGREVLRRPLLCHSLAGASQEHAEAQALWHRSAFIKSPYYHIEIPRPRSNMLEHQFSLSPRECLGPTSCLHELHFVGSRGGGGGGCWSGRNSPTSLRQLASPRHPETLPRRALQNEKRQGLTRSSARPRLQGT